jgi:hypothetical protein
MDLYQQSHYDGRDRQRGNLRCRELGWSQGLWQIAPCSCLTRLLSVALVFPLGLCLVVRKTRALQVRGIEPELRIVTYRVDVIEQRL